MVIHRNITIDLQKKKRHLVYFNWVLYFALKEAEMVHGKKGREQTYKSI